MKKYDVAIVGGGPAGAASAILLMRANENLKVVIVEKGEYPLVRNLGGILNRTTFDEFEFLVEHQERLVDYPIKELKFLSPDMEQETSYTEDGPLAYAVHRSRFDNTMLEIAGEMGVDILSSRAVEKVEAGMDGATLTLQGGEQIESHALVGADGCQSTVAQQMRIYETMERFPLYHCRVTKCETHYFTQSRFGTEKSPLLSLCFGDLKGYAFALPLKDAAFIGVFSQEKDKVEEAFDGWLKGLVEKEYLPENFLRRNEVWDYQNPAGVALLMDRLFEKRTLLVGDAGGFAVGTSGEGLYPSLVSAKIATDIILEGLENDNLDDLIPTYVRKWNLHFGEYIKGAIQINANLSFLIRMIFTDPKICARYAKGFLHGENVL